MITHTNMITLLCVCSLQHRTSDGIVQCQGQNPCGIVAVLTKPVGGSQVDIKITNKVVIVHIKSFLVLESILQGIDRMARNVENTPLVYIPFPPQCLCV